jgi:Domain of unknown function (DUF4276)
VIIQPIVEGHGDIKAMPVLLRRICYELECCVGAMIAPPIRMHRSQMLKEECLRRSVRIACTYPGCNLVMIFLDEDDDCAKDISDLLRPWIENEALCVQCEIVVIPREFETWFVMAINSLRGKRNISDDATATTDLYRRRDPKAIITGWMNGSNAYHETADQVALTTAMDLSVVRENCASFRRLIAKIERHRPSA